MFKGAAVVMGATSSGKTAVGEALAAVLQAPFIEGDDLHSAANVAKMASGIPLTDDDRWPWLAAIGNALAGEGAMVAACSALKRAYREAIARAAGRPVSFIFLSGSREILEQRIKARRGHFMPPSLLDSQLAILEPPGAGERALKLDIEMPVERLVEQARRWLMTQD